MSKNILMTKIKIALRQLSMRHPLAYPVCLYLDFVYLKPLVGAKSALGKPTFR